MGATQSGADHLIRLDGRRWDDPVGLLRFRSCLLRGSGCGWIERPAFRPLAGARRTGVAHSHWQLQERR